MLILAVAGVALIVLWSLLPAPSDLDPRLGLQHEARIPSVDGSLVVSHLRASGSAEDDGPIHRAAFVPGSDGVRMDDNDLRGFLDGVFKWGWNQPSQVHVRFGRRGESPRYGEHELFRVLQRWSGVTLPMGARVAAASLVMHVETGPDHPVEVLVYAVHRDWNPGEGGTRRDNVSPPSAGEVWWNGPRFGEESWGLPGVGYAGSGTAGDTPVTALGTGLFQPGDSLLVVSGEGLARYVEEQATSGESLRFLIKVADVQEDRPGSLVTVYSGDYGDSGSRARRPRFEVEWSHKGDRTLLDEAVLLEHGRSAVLGPLAPPEDGWLSIEFAPDAGSASPTLEVRGGKSLADTSAWTPARYAFRVDWHWLDVRVSAYQNPLPMGERYQFAVRDTWVLGKDPEDVSLVATFLAPSGRITTANASYEGDYLWRVEFLPDEFGTWQYQWIADFVAEPAISPVGRFQVVVDGEASLARATQDLIEDLRVVIPPEERLIDKVVGRLSDVMGRPRERDYLYLRFLGIERAALGFAMQEPTRVDLAEVRSLLLPAREILGGLEVPDSISLMASPADREGDLATGGGDTD